MENKFRITITSTPDGGVKFEVNGVKGSRCQALTAIGEAALGTKTSDEIKPEFYEEEVNYDAENTVSNY